MTDAQDPRLLSVGRIHTISERHSTMFGNAIVSQCMLDVAALLAHIAAQAEIIVAKDARKHGLSAVRYLADILDGPVENEQLRSFVQVHRGSLRLAIKYIFDARAEAFEEAAKRADQSAEYWRTADASKEVWTPEQMTMRLTEAGYLAAQIRALAEKEKRDGK